MIWLDLEIRADIDDLLVLIYALENNIDVKYISIHNPSMKELSVINHFLNVEFDKDIEVIIAGEITEYPDGEDINASLLKYVNVELVKLSLQEEEYEYLKDFLDYAVIPDDLIVFCGGSLYTLSKLLEVNSNITPYVQGGYAGSNVIDDEKAIEKFKGRVSVPTWNLNLDLDSTQKAMALSTKMFFISKNICHRSFLPMELLTGWTLLQRVLADYYALKNKKMRNKCLHDVLAFLSIFDKDLVEFKKVDLICTGDSRPKWRSELNEDSKFSISVDFDYELYLSKLL